MAIKSAQEGNSVNKKLRSMIQQEFDYRYIKYIKERRTSSEKFLVNVIDRRWWRRKYHQEIACTFVTEEINPLKS